MATEVSDLAADLLAALGSSIVEESPQDVSSASLPLSTEPAIPSLESAVAAALPDPVTTPTATNPAVPAISAPQEPVTMPSPKRQRTPDFAGEGDAKRQKTDHDPSNLDMAMLLESALGSLDGQLMPEEDVDVVGIEEIPVLPSATATPAPTKPDPKLMRAADNPVFMMRSMSLPVLGNLAVQILLRLSQQPRKETEALLADKSTEFRKTYEMLKNVFGPARKLFSESALLLSCDELDISDSEDRETVRMSNLATVGLSILDSHEVPLRDVHDQFLSIFVPELGEYKESLTDFYITLKTQAFLREKQGLSEGQSISELLDQYFPANFEEALKQRNGEMFLSFSEDLLVAAVKERRDTLNSALNSTTDSSSQAPASESEQVPQAPSASVAELYPLERLGDDFSAHLQAHLGVIVEYAEKYGVNIPVAEEPTASVSPAAEEPNPEDPAVHDDLAALLQSATAKMAAEEIEMPRQDEPDLVDSLGLSNIIQQSLENEMDLASLIRENLGDTAEAKAQTSYNMPSYANMNGEVNGQPQFQSLAQLNQLHASPYHSYTQTVPQVSHSVNENGDLLPPNQSSPTAILYERARQAAVAKSSSSTRREGLHSTRRPWTPEEEKALMAGLDMVKGPHWSQILSLFGVNGTVSDILKDRTQVQLKDKARNLKLFFLKTSSEMPYYLQSVTGELKTRAPSQAARKEAEEKARVNSEEEQARLQGIMTLAGGLQNNHPNAVRPPMPTSTPVHTSPMGPRAGPTGMAGTAVTQGPATAAHASPLGLARSPDIKSEPADHSGIPHNLPQNGVPISQQLAQMHSRVKQEVHGLPQIQPRIQTPHTPLAPAPQPQAQMQSQVQNQAQTVPRPASQTPGTHALYRPPQLTQSQPQSPAQAQQQVRPLGQPSQSSQQLPTPAQPPAQSAVQLQNQSQGSLSTPLQRLTPNLPSGQVQTPAQALAQAQAQSQQPSQPQLAAQSAPQAETPSNPAQPAQPGPLPEETTAPSNYEASSLEHALAQAEPANHHSMDDSAEASLLETLRAAMASAPESHVSLVSSEAPAA